MKPAFGITCFCLALGQVAPSQSVGPVNAAARPASRTLAANYGNLPLSFEANQGQSDRQVKFHSRGSGYSLFLTDNGAVLALTNKEPASLLLQPESGLTGARASVRTDVVRMELVGASQGLTVEGAERLPGTANYFIGNDPAKWQTDVPTFQEVRYSGVYPGVDLVYYGNQRQLEYDFVVAPGADLKTVKLHFAGATKLRLAPDGDLMVAGKNGEIAFHKPVVYQLKTGQPRGGQRDKVNGRFVLLAGNLVEFAVGTYDTRRELVIDPVLAYSTYLGEAGSDAANAIAVDAYGHAYMTGYTLSAKFPTVDPYQGTNNDASNGVAFVTKLNAPGNALVYSTYLGGGGACQADTLQATVFGDVGNAIAVDASGDAYVAGQTCSTDFPLEKPYQSKNNAPGRFNAFVAKLNPTGSGLIYSTYLGGTGGDSSGDRAFGIAVDASGDAYVAGQAFSHNFPTTAGVLQGGDPSANDSPFVTKFNAAGSALLYSTYLGSNYSGAAFATTVDSSGDAYVTGCVLGGAFPITSNAFQSTNNGSGGNCNVFVSKLNPKATAVLYSTYLGGSGASGIGDKGLSIAIDSTGNAYVTGYAYSQNFPLMKAIEAKDPEPVGQSAAFVAKLDTGASGALLYSTYLGGTGGDQGNGIAVDAVGHIYVTGYTYSKDFPLAGSPFQSSYKGGTNKASNAFFTELNAPGNALVYSTYLGGAGNTENSSGDSGNGIALDSLKNPYIAGYSYSANFPTLKTSFQPATKATAGNSNAFIARFAFATATMTTLVSDENPAPPGATVTFTAYVPPASGSEILPSGKVTFSIDGGAGTAATLDDTGHAAFSTAMLASGNHSVAATYSGDVNYKSSVSAPLTETILSSTTTGIESSVNPSASGQSVTFTATVKAASGATPTGTITFTHGGVAYPAVTLSGGVATYTTSTLPVGTHGIKAEYSGSSTDAASTSGTLNQVVNQ